MSDKTETAFKSADEIIISFANEINSIYTTSKDFAVEQIPLVVQELLLYNAVMSLMGTVVGIVLLVIPFYLFKIANEKTREGRDNEEANFFVDRNGGADAGWALPYISIFVGGLLGSIFILSNLDWIKIFLAPRLYLIEYATSLVK